MRILHIITSLQTGGAEKLMVDLLPRMKERGHTVELLLIDGTRTPFYEQLEQKGVTIHSLGTGGGIYSVVKLVKMVLFLRKHRYDIVHTHNTASQLFAAMAAKVLCSVVLCTTEHTTSNRRRDLKWYAPFDKWMYRQYKAVICISDQAESNLREYLNSAKYPICTIYNGIDVNLFANAEPDMVLLNAKVGKKAIVMVAGFRYQKDQETLIRAMKMLPADYVLWLVGDGERRALLQSLVEEEGVTEKVKFLGLRSDVPNVLKAADIVVMSSHFEGLSLSNLEGMASGRPFIASDVDGLREIVKGYGVLFPHGDAKAFAAEVQKFMADKEYYNKVAAQCSKRASDFDISRMVEGYLNVYKSILKRS